MTLLTETQNQQEKDVNQKAIADAGARAAASAIARATKANARAAIRDAACKRRLRLCDGAAQIEKVLLWLLLNRT